MKTLTTCLVAGAIALHGSAAAAAAAAQEEEAPARDDGPSRPPSSPYCANDHDNHDNTCPGPCINADPDCIRRAALGECKLQSHAQYITTHCSRACGRCSLTQLPDEATIQKEEEEELRSNEANDSPELDLDCHDLHEMCPIWSGQGECLLNPKYMATACRESCLLCVNARTSRERGEDTERIRRKRTYVTSVDAGPQQRMDGSITEQQQDKIRNLLQHMDRYAKVNLTDVEVSRETRMLCRNDHDECAILAVQGQCRKDTLYMLAHCSLVCQFCDKVEKFHRCAATTDNGIGNAETSGLFHKAGDLNSFFRQAKEGGRWDEYRPEYLSQPGGHANADGEADANDGSPWVVRFDSFLSASESKRMIDIANIIGWSDSKVEEKDMFGGNPEKVPPQRSSKSAVCRAGAACDSEPVYTAVMKRVADTIGIPREHFEHTEIVKYEHRDSFGVHHDYRIHDLWKPGGCSSSFALTNAHKFC